MSSTPDPDPKADLPNVVDPSQDEEDEPITITDHGSVAHFEMSYSPPKSDRVRFAAPLRQRVPSIVFFAVAAVFGLIVLAAYQGVAPEGITRWIVAGDRNRGFTTQALSIVLLACAAATIIRAHMRGVVVNPDWIESRQILPLGIPSAKRWAWIQVNRVIVDDKSVALELMDGAFERLPAVAELAKMRDFFVASAIKRKIQITRLK